MKHLKILMSTLLMLALTVSLQSCLKDDGDDYSIIYPNALVTLKTNSGDGAFYLQLDDSTTLLPTNMKASPYGNKEVRALINFRYADAQSGSYSKAAYVNWIDTVRTKKMAQDLGGDNKTTYGNDPLEVVNDWTTVVEDGYLTLRFRTYFDLFTIHSLNLVKGDNPYEVVLYHDAKGDVNSEVGDGLIAFRLDQLPDTEGKTVDLTLKWQSFSGEKSIKFKYRTRK